jgi:hypothetical protein
VKRAKKTALQQRSTGSATVIFLLKSKAIEEEGGVASSKGNAIAQNALAQ